MSIGSGFKLISGHYSMPISTHRGGLSLLGGRLPQPSDVLHASPLRSIELLFDLGLAQSLITNSLSDAFFRHQLLGSTTSAFTWPLFAQCIEATKSGQPSSYLSQAKDPQSSRVHYNRSLLSILYPVVYRTRVTIPTQDEVEETGYSGFTVVVIIHAYTKGADVAVNIDLPGHIELVHC